MDYMEVIQNEVAPHITMLWIPPNIAKLYITTGEHFNGWSATSFCPQLQLDSRAPEKAELMP